MPVGPSTRMQTLAARWLTDSVVLSEVVYPTDTRPLAKTVAIDLDQALTDDDGNLLYTDDFDEFVDDFTETFGTVTEVLYADDPAEIAALVRSETVELIDSQNVRRSVRELVVWVDDETAVAGQRLTVMSCGDATLVGRFGQVITVERDTIRAVRRLRVRLGNNE